MGYNGAQVRGAGDSEVREKEEAFAEEEFIKHAEACMLDMIRLAMVLRGKSVGKVAEEAGVNTEWLEKVLGGREELPAWLIGRLAQVLDFSVDFNMRPSGGLSVPTRVSLSFGDG